ncbi:energy transducer TonB [Muricauda sp. SCSIO 64092]|uniref:energy transducer TonB n=1 Tax=Allomuricauda sp. SCSIO 64092 TaxID=2908842 RepID=UPI001FF66840|nr:energy transducer TonB [Muricauda sp. SCSIO 64092]UOY05110.1 energy transducer TonB [Muricauda sp. SCSIO 64092]
MSFLDTRHKKKSFTLTTVLLSLLVLVLFYIGLTYLDPPEEKGIAINFGTMDFGSGNRQPLQKIKSEPRDIPKPPNEPQKEVIEEKEAVAEKSEPKEEVKKEEPTEKVITQDSEETIRLKQEREAKRKAEEAAKKAKAEAERKERERAEAEARKREEEDAKKRKLDALMGGIGKSEGTETGSEGDDDRAGDKGRPEGNPYATSYYGAPGAGTGGYGLNGRSLVSKGKVQQECNEDGRVVVRIVVDRNGKVIKATPGVKGTTNNAPCLLEPAKKTAFLHQWNLDSNAPSQQVGFVVVNFKLGQ